jgi:hypothetical protein
MEIFPNSSIYIRDRISHNISQTPAPLSSKTSSGEYDNDAPSKISTLGNRFSAARNLYYAIVIKRQNQIKSKAYIPSFWDISAIFLHDHILNISLPECDYAHKQSIKVVGLEK